MENKKNIDVKNQVTLSFQKSFLFCRKGISYRLFRSSLTLAVVVVAVAFFTVLLSEGLIVRSTSVGVYDAMRNDREADALLMHLFHLLLQLLNLQTETTKTIKTNLLHSQTK